MAPSNAAIDISVFVKKFNQALIGVNCQILIYETIELQLFYVQNLMTRFK